MWRRSPTQPLTDPQRVETLVRRQLARRLHDGPAQSVAALAMRADLAQRLGANGSDAELEKLEELARATTRDLRYLQFTLSPQSLSTAGLEIALQDLAAQLESLYSQKTELDVDSALLEKLPQSSQQQLFLIATEALENVRRHAEVGIASLHLHSPERGVLLLEVKDEGRGFDTGIIAHCEADGKLGLAIIVERVRLLRGELHIDSFHGVGCHLRAAVPIER
jgi:signal transduction histidine kinase